MSSDKAVQKEEVDQAGEQEAEQQIDQEAEQWLIEWVRVRYPQILPVLTWKVSGFAKVLGAVLNTVPRSVLECMPGDLEESGEELSVAAGNRIVELIDTWLNGNKTIVIEFCNGNEKQDGIVKEELPDRLKEPVAA